MRFGATLNIPSVGKDKSDEGRSFEEFEEAIKDVLFVVSFKFHGLVLSIIYNRIPIIDMKSFKCNDLMRSICLSLLG